MRRCRSLVFGGIVSAIGGLCILACGCGDKHEKDVIVKQRHPHKVIVAPPPPPPHKVIIEKKPAPPPVVIKKGPPPHDVIIERKPVPRRTGPGPDKKHNEK